MTSKPTGSKKKPYRAPRLVEYGGLRRLTSAVIIKGGTKGDGAGALKTKL